MKWGNSYHVPEVPPEVPPVPKSHVPEVPAALSRFADLLELSLDEQAALDGFETRSPNGRPLGAADFIAGIEAKLGRTVRPGRRGRKPQGGRMD